eukprot:jgi/Psemu1/237319/estExt_Genewise1.C_670017
MSGAVSQTKDGCRKQIHPSTHPLRCVALCCVALRCVTCADQETNTTNRSNPNPDHGTGWLHVPYCTVSIRVAMNERITELRAAVYR